MQTNERPELRALFVFLSHFPGGNTTARIASALGWPVDDAHRRLMDLLYRGLVQCRDLMDPKVVTILWAVKGAIKPGDRGQAGAAFDAAVPE